MSTTRTGDQTTAAIFWQAATAAPWNGVFRSLAVKHGLDVADAARLFAITNLAAADGAVACWSDKYCWNFWRPIAAIREADTDDNPETEADPTWKPLFDPSTATVPPLGTPPFPDHPSGHGCVSGAILYAAQEFFGTDEVAFDVNSGRFPGEPRHFYGFAAAIQEIIDARVWDGIHFRTADVQAAEIGNAVALWLSDHYFQPVPCQSQGPATDPIISPTDLVHLRSRSVGKSESDVGGNRLDVGHAFVEPIGDARFVAMTADHEGVAVPEVFETSGQLGAVVIIPGIPVFVEGVRVDAGGQERVALQVPQRPCPDGGLSSLVGGAEEVKKKGVHNVHTLGFGSDRIGSYRCRTGPDWRCVRGSGGNSGPGTRFESHLGHSVFPAQGLFWCFFVWTVSTLSPLI